MTCMHRSDPIFVWVCVIGFACFPKIDKLSKQITEQNRTILVTQFDGVRGIKDVDNL